MTASSRYRARLALTSSGAVITLCAIVAFVHNSGLHARHMGVHILAMNVAAPLLALLLTTRCRRLQASWLWAATVAQIVLLWTAHVPAIQDAMMHGYRQTALQSVLMVAALSFWVSLLSLTYAQRWHAILALLLTGKLVCLLGALLVFAPRTLYGVGHHAHSVDDQHLAALLMLSACPLSYLVAATVIAAELIPRTASVLYPARGEG